MVEVGFSEPQALAEEICRHGADVLVLDPPELRRAVLAGLRAVAGTGAA